LKDQVNVIVLAIMAIVFFVLAVKYNDPWAQMMAYSAFTGACVAMQITPKSSPPPSNPNP